MASGGAWLERHGPCAAMVLVQLMHALLDVALKTAYGLGLRPIVFVTYRQGVAAATLLLASLAAGGGTLRAMAVGARAFGLVFAAALSIATAQYLYLQGLQLASPSMARATTNLAPGFIFAIAAVIGMEKVELRSSRSLAKIVGTAICVLGAAFMALYKGPKILGAVQLLVASDWVKGEIYLVGTAVCSSISYILQVPICKSYLDPLSLAAWMCVLGSLQCAVIAFFLEPHTWQTWKLTSPWQLPCILYAGIFASGATFFLQSWSISVKGPVYAAIFTPLGAVITAVLSVALLDEQLHVGSVLGAIAIISGLYVVLWGKTGDAKSESPSMESGDSEGTTADTDSIRVRVDCPTKLSEPLLSDESAGL